MLHDLLKCCFSISTCSVVSFRTSCLAIRFSPPSSRGAVGVRFPGAVDWAVVGGRWKHVQQTEEKLASGAEQIAWLTAAVGQKDDHIRALTSSINDIAGVVSQAQQLASGEAPPVRLQCFFYTRVRVVDCKPVSGCSVARDTSPCLTML
jgi:hypothetical protein